jgi:hypothetical protein
MPSLPMIRTSHYHSKKNNGHKTTTGGQRMMVERAVGEGQKVAPIVGFWGLVICFTKGSFYL